MKTYPLFRVHVQAEKALDNVRAVFESGFINEGTQVTELTKQLGKHLESDRLLLTNSCTSALTMALRLAGVRANDEVITTPMTCVATNTPILTMDADVVWADIDAKSGMILSLDVEEKLAELNSKATAVMAVAWAGTPPNLSALRRVCDDAGVPLILDAAHAFGAKYLGEPIHAFADYTCYSFQAIKHFTTGDGGALICNDRDDFRRAKAMKWFGLDRDLAKDERGDWKGQQWDVDIVEAGYKFNMNNVAAAIGLSQMESIGPNVEKHRHNARLYDELFKSHPGVHFSKRPKGADSSFWVYTMLNESQNISRDDLLRHLNAEGIMAGVVHVPNDTYTCFKRFQSDLPGVRAFSGKQFSLPCGWWLNDDDIRHIATRVKELTT